VCVNVRTHPHRSRVLVDYPLAPCIWPPNVSGLEGGVLAALPGSAEYLHVLQLSNELSGLGWCCYCQIRRSDLCLSGGSSAPSRAGSCQEPRSVL
jgi:hypothetical protein